MSAIQYPGIYSSTRSKKILMNNLMVLMQIPSNAISRLALSTPPIPFLYCKMSCGYWIFQHKPMVPYQHNYFHQSETAKNIQEMTVSLLLSLPGLNVSSDVGMSFFLHRNWILSSLFRTGFILNIIIIFTTFIIITTSTINIIIPLSSDTSEIFIIINGCIELRSQFYQIHLQNWPFYNFF